MDKFRKAASYEDVYLVLEMSHLNPRFEIVKEPKGATVKRTNSQREVAHFLRIMEPSNSWLLASDKSSK
jgi:hypothetical protein